MTGPVPDVRYAPSDGFKIAYQVFGDGPIDIVLVPGFISHVEYGWHDPLLARFLRRLGTFARVIAFDKRGMGLSDRDPRRDTPTLDERMADIDAVLDAAGSTRSALFAWSEGGPTAIAYAHSRAERAVALMLIATTARFTQSADFLAGIPAEVLETFIETMVDEWGTGVGYELHAPTLADDARTRDWWASYQRYAATPGAVEASLRLHLELDVRGLLGGLTVPTLVLHRTGDLVIPVECGRHLGAAIPGARYIELSGVDHMYWVGDQDAVLNAVRARLIDSSAGAALSALRQKRRPARSGWEALTASELDVVRLLASGMTNQQIADRLVVSPRTVQTHVSHVLAKLDLRNRAEVAYEAARRLR